MGRVSAARRDQRLAMDYGAPTFSGMPVQDLEEETWFMKFRHFVSECFKKAPAFLATAIGVALLWRLVGAGTRREIRKYLDRAWLIVKEDVLDRLLPEREPRGGSDAS